jgi:uncharacterized protein YbjT (DUF2867 family)
MQNFVQFYGQSITEKDEFYFPDKDLQFSWVDVRDIAAVDTEILLNPSVHQNKDYTVTGSEALTFSRIATILSKVTGRSIRFVEVSNDQYIAAMRSMGAPEWSIGMTMSLWEYAKTGKGAEVSNTVFSLTGRNPITFEQFVRDYAKNWGKVLVTA